MGCDIHLHIEVLVGEDFPAYWEHWAAPAVKRNYDMFAKMANVRNDGSIKPIAWPRGLPNDASPLTYMAYKEEEADAHSTSYLTVDEIAELAEFLKTLRPDTSAKSWLEFDLEHGILGTYLFGNSFTCKEDWPKWVKDVRFVFWFDN